MVTRVNVCCLDGVLLLWRFQRFWQFTKFPTNTFNALHKHLSKWTVCFVPLYGEHVTAEWVFSTNHKVVVWLNVFSNNNDIANDDDEMRAISIKTKATNLLMVVARKLSSSIFETEFIHWLTWIPFNSIPKRKMQPFKYLIRRPPGRIELRNRIWSLSCK